MDQKQCNLTDAEFACDINNPIPVMTLDQLNDRIPYTDIVMKIDIEGYEHKAFKTCDSLLSDKNIRFMQMEWQMLRKIKNREEEKEVEQMIEKFKKHQLVPYSEKGKALGNKRWKEWTPDIAWIKEEK